VTAKARVLRQGRTALVVEVEASGAGEPLALGTMGFTTGGPAALSGGPRQAPRATA
jgi:acyl-coenzyme A thioesterase PaaI-like protein